MKTLQHMGGQQVGHTGPNACAPARRSGMHQHKNHFLAHERLAIIDPASGDQPLYNEDKTIWVTVNGEIYNYKALMAHIQEKCPNKKFATHSDCEVGEQGWCACAKHASKRMAKGSKPPDRMATGSSYGGVAEVLHHDSRVIMCAESSMHCVAAAATSSGC